MDKDKFKKACEYVYKHKNNNNNSLDSFNKIGTLKEKSVHAVLKKYFEPDESFHEVKIEGFIADIFNKNEVYEIQSSGFHLLKPKLELYLAKKYSVNIIYPVFETKLICWIDPSSLKLSETRKSPKKENYNYIFNELYKIKPYLKHASLNIILVKLEAYQHKLLNGFGKHKKSRATKGDILPKNILDILYIKNHVDFKEFIPKDLKANFTTKDYAKCAKIPMNISQKCLNVLFYMDVVKRVGKIKNAYVYKVN